MSNRESTLAALARLWGVACLAVASTAPYAPHAAAQPAAAPPALPAPPARAREEAAIKAVIQAFIDTRERNDAAGLAALLTADVDQQQTSGNTRRGRDAVVAGSLGTQRETGGKRAITVDSLRFLSDDVAIADGQYDSLGRADGTDRRMRTSMVLKREGGAWKIAAIRNALPTGR